MKATVIQEVPNGNSRAYLLFTYLPIGGHSWLVFYELVLPLEELDIRGTFENPSVESPGDAPDSRTVYLAKDNSMRLPLGRTEVTAYEGYPMRGENISLPFRDGAHAQWDRERLGGLAVYAKTPTALYAISSE